MELLIIDSTHKLSDEIKNLIYENNKKYYTDVLDFMNLLFEDQSIQIIKLKFKKVKFDDNIFIFYNTIIDKYNLNKPKFDYENFDYDSLDKDDSNYRDYIFEIVYKLTNNLLEKLNYKVQRYMDKIENKKKLKIILVD